MSSTVTAAVCVVMAVGVSAVAIRPRLRRAEAAAEPAPSRVVELTSLLMRRNQPRQRPTARSVAAWLDEVSRRLRSGSSLRDAVAVVPSDPVTERASAALRLAIDRGLPMGDSVGRVNDPGQHLRLALDVIATTGRIGGPAAASIDRTAALLRQRAADLDERSSQAAQARLSTHVMTAVPLLMLAALLATDDDVRSATSSPIGATCIATGLALNLAGWCWMRRIVGARA